MLYILAKNIMPAKSGLVMTHTNPHLQTQVPYAREK